jgi:hypothetical protein
MRILLILYFICLSFTLPMSTLAMDSSLIKPPYGSEQEEGVTAHCVNSIIPRKMIDEISKADDHKQTQVGICFMPKEVIVKFFFNLTPPVDIHQGIGLTCRFFSCFASALQLSPHWLQEANLHTLPVALLVFIAKNSKDGVLKIADLYSVSSDNLKAWFGTEYLGTLNVCEAIPKKAKHLSEDEAKILYPLVKINLAATNTLGLFREECTTAVRSTMLEYYHDTFNPIDRFQQLRLCTLTPNLFLRNSWFTKCVFPLIEEITKQKDNQLLNDFFNFMKTFAVTLYEHHCADSDFHSLHMPTKYYEDKRNIYNLLLQTGNHEIAQKGFPNTFSISNIFINAQSPD